MAGGPQKIPTPTARRLEGFRRGVMPVIVWLLAVGAVGALLAGRGRSMEAVAWALPIQHEVSAGVTGQIADAPVVMYQMVLRGQVLIRLEDHDLMERIQASQAAVESLRAELATARQRMIFETTSRRDEQQAELHRLHADEEDYHLKMLATRVALEADRIAQERLKLQTARYEATLKQEGVVSLLDYDNSRLEEAEVAKRVEQNTILLEQTRKDWQQAAERRAAHERESRQTLEGQSWFDALGRAIAEQERLVEVLGLQRGALQLVAPADGQITQMLAAPGQGVVPGEALLMLTESAPREIVAYVRPEELEGIGESMTVDVIQSGDRRRMPARVAGIGTAVEQLPVQLWRDPTRPEFGRPLMIHYDARMNLIPGERVTVRLNREG